MNRMRLCFISTLRAWNDTWKDLGIIEKMIQGVDVDYDPNLAKVEYYTLCLEDRRFFAHCGFDPLSIIRAFLIWLTGRDGGGASTIEQQLVRTITNRRERTLWRKVREIVLACIISRRYGKIRLLRVYLGIAYFGYGLNGICRSSEAHFAKKPEHLSDDEAALLAGLLLYPCPKKINQRWEHLIRRRANYAIRVGKFLHERSWRYAKLGIQSLKNPALTSRNIQTVL